jgi:hypothetical protein
MLEEINCRESGNHEHEGSFCSFNVNKHFPVSTKCTFVNRDRATELKELKTSQEIASQKCDEGKGRRCVDTLNV